MYCCPNNEQGNNPAPITSLALLIWLNENDQHMTANRQMADTIRSALQQHWDIAPISLEYTGES